MPKIEISKPKPEKALARSVPNSVNDFINGVDKYEKEKRPQLSFRLPESVYLAMKAAIGKYRGTRRMVDWVQEAIEEKLQREHGYTPLRDLV